MSVKPLRVPKRFRGPKNRKQTMTEWLSDRDTKRVKPKEKKK